MKTRGRIGFLSALGVTGAVMIGMASGASAQTVSGIVVPGTSNPFLAGMPPGSTASGDTAPAQSPVQVLGLNIAGGGTLTFTAAGLVGNTPTPSDGPDGGGFFSRGAENGISGYTIPVNSLLGVFLTDAQPDLTAVPTALDFSSGTPGTSFASLSPDLKQTFFIGDGLTGTGTGTVQEFLIPVGATRFYLGTADGFGWFNNSGSFTVSVTQTGAASASAPEPGSIALALTAALPVIGLVRRRHAR